MTKPFFPEPLRFGARNRYWRLSDLIKFEAAISGIAEPKLPEPADETFLTAPQVCRRYSVSHMWIERQLQRSRAEQAVA
jgi:hypothetical protein